MSDRPWGTRGEVHHLPRLAAVLRLGRQGMWVDIQGAEKAVDLCQSGGTSPRTRGTRVTR